jgi:predicted nucleotidyltransferase
MIELIERHRSELMALCRRHHVKILEVFGSAADGSFDSAKSDLDFLVDYLPLRPSQHADAYFGLLHDLQELFHRKVDLVETAAIDNPYLLKSVNQSRRVLYAA